MNIFLFILAGLCLLVTLQGLDGSGSDHFPIYAALQYEPEVQSQQDIPQPEGKDLQEAEEKILKPDHR